MQKLNNGWKQKINFSGIKTHKMIFTALLGLQALSQPLKYLDLLQKLHEQQIKLNYSRQTI